MSALQKSTQGIHVEIDLFSSSGVFLAVGEHELPRSASFRAIPRHWSGCGTGGSGGVPRSQIKITMAPQQLTKLAFTMLPLRRKILVQFQPSLTP